MPWSHHHQSDGISENILSESAQIRSALQSKTYLQALSPDERRRLLKGTKVLGEAKRLVGQVCLVRFSMSRPFCACLAGHRRKQHTSAVAAATARRDELQQLLDQDKDDFIDSQTVLAQQPDVSYSSKPAAHEVSTWQAPPCCTTRAKTPLCADALLMALVTHPLALLVT